MQFSELGNFLSQFSKLSRVPPILVVTCQPCGQLRSPFEDFGNIDAESCGEVVLVVLLLGYDFAELLRERVVAEGLGLFDPLAVVFDGFGFVVQVEAKHVFRFLRQLYRFWGGRRFTA